MGYKKQEKRPLPFNPQEALNIKHSFLTDGGASAPRILYGISVHHGLTAGYAFVHKPLGEITRLHAKDPQKELLKLDKALKHLKGDLDQLQESLADDNPAVHDILDAFRLIAQDRGWINRMQQTIQEGFTAQAAALKFLEYFKAQVIHKENDVLKDRLWDVEDLTGRLMKYMRNNAVKKALTDTTRPFIVLAKSLGPADFLEYRQYPIRALILEEGIHSAHVSIIAKALDIPMIISVPDLIKRVKPGESMLVDGRLGKIVLSPSDLLEKQFQGELLRAETRKKMANQALKKAAVTKDGVPVELKINAGLVGDLDSINLSGAQGVGLFRTEIPFMLGQDFLKLSEQVKIYQQVIEEALPHAVTFRTLDIGGDKILPYIKHKDEANPMMGWRAIRIGLDRPMLLRTQLRAMLKAGAGQSVHIMFPMVTNLAEVLKAKEILGMEMAFAQANNILPPFEVKMGVMIEVPALVWDLHHILPHVDFLSIGTNDLCQFFFAADRGNPHISKRYDTLSPVFLRFLGHIYAQVKASGKPLTVCGEMASTPLEMLALLTLGYRSFSLSPSALGAAKLLLQSTSLYQVSAFMQNLLSKPLVSVRNDLRAFAQDHGIFL